MPRKDFFAFREDKGLSKEHSGTLWAELKLATPSINGAITPRAFEVEHLESRLLLSAVPVVLPLSVTAANTSGTAQKVSLLPAGAVSNATPVQSGSQGMSAGGLEWQFDAQTGTLVLGGTASAEIQRQAPAPTSVVADSVVPPPTVSAPAGAGVTFNGTSSSVNVGAGITLDSQASLTSASVTIASGYEQGEDVLTIAGQTGSSGTLSDGLSWQFNSKTGTLSLSGAGTAATYEGDLQQVTFKDSLFLANAPPTNGIRQLTVTATNAGGTASTQIGSLDVNVAYLEYSTSQGTTLYATNPGSTVILGGSSSDASQSATDVVLDPTQVSGLGTGGTVNIGVSTDANTLVVGDGSSNTVNLPGTTTVLTGNEVYFDSSATVGNLVVNGSGHTTFFGSNSGNTNVVASGGETVNDSVVVDATSTVTAQAGSIAFQSSGTVDAGGAGVSLTLTASQSVSTGAIGTDADPHAVGLLQNLTITATAGSVTVAGTTDISGNLNVTAGTTMTFTGQVTVGGNVTLSGGGAINFEGGLSVTGGLTITHAGSVTFSNGNVRVVGAVAIGSSSTFGNITSVNFTPTARLDYGGTAAIYATGGLTFGAAVGLDNTLTPLSLGLGSNGPIQFSSGAQVLLGNAPLTVSRTTNLSFSEGFTAGSVALEGISGSLTVSNNATIGYSMDATAQSAATFAGISVGPGGAVITANSISFTGGSDSVAVSGSASALTLKPYTTSENIGVGSPGGSSTGRLNITDADLTAINAGFSLVTIGDAAAGTGAVVLGGVGEFYNGTMQNPTEVVGGALTVTFPTEIESTANYLQLVARAGAITVNSNINTTVNDQNPWVLMQASGNIVINDPVEATDTISLVAGYGTGTGSVTVNGTGSNTGSLTTLNSATLGGLLGEPDNRIEIVSGTTSGGITINGTGSTNEINATGTGSQVVLSATGGAISQTGLISATNLAVTASGNVTLNTNVQTVASETINGFILTGGSGATATATLSGTGVGSVAINTSGTLYNVEPTVTLVGGGGSGATATSVINGSVTGITVTNAGAGYTSAPTVSFSGGGGSGATATAILSGGISWIAVSAGGTGYTSAPTVSFTGGSGSGATATATVINGSIVGITVTAAGSGYTSAPTVNFTGAGSGAVAAAVLNESVTSINVTAAGSNYTSAPTVTITGGGGTAAAGIANISGGVTGVAITSAGVGYIYAPTVVFGSGAGALVVNGIEMVGSGSVTITQAAAIAINNVSTASVGATPGSFTLTTAPSSGGNIAVGTMDTISGAITLTADGAITDAGAGSTDVVTSGELIATAKTGIGARISPGPIQTSIGSLQATNSVSGGIFITDTDGLNIVGTGVQTQAGNGSIVILASDGSLTVNAPVSANGSGNILLNAQGSTASNSDVLDTANVTTGTGFISIFGNRNVDFGGSSSVSVPGTGGDVDVVATTGAIAEASTFQILTNGANILIQAATNVLVGVIDARVSADRTSGLLTSQSATSNPWGTIAVVATAGTITGAEPGTTTATEIFANGLELNSGTGIGVLSPGAANPIETEVATVAAETTVSGGIAIQDATAITEDAIGSFHETRVATLGVPVTFTVSGLSQITTASGGSIVLTTLNGPITLNQAVTANGAGNVLINAVGAGSTVTGNASVESTTGNITVVAAATVSFAAAENIETTGSVDVEGTSGSVTFDPDSEVTSGGGNVRIVAGVSVTVGGVNAGSGNVAITAGSGSIIDGGDAFFTNVTASSLWLNAGTGIGTSATPLEAAVGTITAAAGSGGIYVQVPSTISAVTVNTVTFTLSKVNADATVSTATVTAQQDLTTSSGGNIQLVTVGGSIALDDGTPTNSISVSANGAGTVTINAQGTGFNLTINANVTSGTGNVSLTAADNVTQNANVTTGGSGTVGVTATSGSITMADLTTTTSGTGAITYLAADNVALSLIASASGALNVTATSGAITDNTAAETANLSTTGLVTLLAATGIGGTGSADINTTIGSLAATNTTSGPIVINQVGALSIASGGAKNQGSSGTIIVTVSGGTLAVGGAVSATGAGLILLSTSGSGANITTSAAISSGTGALSILAANSVTLGGAVTTGGTGTLDIEGAAGSVTINDNVAVSTAGGNVLLKANGSVAVTGVNAGTGSVTVTATTGSITDGGDTLTDVTAASVRMSAAIGIGTGLLPVELATATVAAAATSGGIYLKDNEAVTVGTVAAVGVSQVLAGGTTSSIGDSASTSDLATTGGGAIWLTTTAGSITLTDGSISNNLAIDSDTGSITVTAQTDVLQQTRVSTGGSGTVGVTATTGSVTMSAGTTTTSGTGAITYNAAQNVALSVLTSTSGALTVTATAGSITNVLAPATTVNLSSAALGTLTAATGIGSASPNNLNTTVGSLTATNTTSGGIFIIQTTALTIASGGVRTQGGNGPISIVVQDGSFTVNGAVSANGSGNVLLEAEGSVTPASDLLVNAAVSSGSGSITLEGFRNVTFTTPGDVTVAGSGGTIDVYAENGAIAQAAASDAQTDGSNIIFHAATNIVVGIVDARVTSDQGGTTTSQSSWGNVALTATAGTITNAQARVASGTNLYANNLRLESFGGIGVLGSGANNPVVTEVVTVAAVTDSAVSGDINLLEDTGVAVGAVAVFSANVVAEDASVSTTSTSALSGLTTTTGSTGSIVLATTNGTMTVSTPVSAGGSGNILLEAQGAASDVLASAAIGTVSGSIEVWAGRNATFTGTANVTVANAAGTIDVVAAAGAVSQLAALEAQTDGANISFAAGTNIVLGIVDARVTSDRSGTLTSQSSWGNVALKATGGTITNARARVASVTNIYANNLRLESSTGIGVLGSGANNPIVTEVVTVAAKTDSASSGNIDLLEDTAVTAGAVAVFPVNAVAVDNTTSASPTTALSGISTATGSTGAIVLVTTNGTITVSNAVSAGGSGNVLLEAQGATSDVLASAAIGSGSGSIEVWAARNATFTGTANIKVTGAGGTVEVVANAGAISQLAALEAQTDGSNILFAAATDIVLGIVDARVTSDQGGTLTSQSGWGNVSLRATGGTITNAQTRVASATNVYANNLRIESSTGIGVLGSGTNNPIVTEMATVAAKTDSATSGDINLLEDTAATVGTVAVFSANSVGIDNTTSASSTTALSGLTTTTGSTGSIVVMTTNGTITVSTPVSAGGSGNILLEAQGTNSDVLASAAIGSGSGDIEVWAARNATFTGTANVTVTSAGGTIDIVASAGAISQLAALKAQTDGANILFTAGTNIVLGIVDARVTSDQGGTLTSQSSWGSVALTATGGTLTNAQTRVAGSTNIYAKNLRVESSTGIGVLGSGTNNPIVTEVVTVAGKTDSATSGDINLLEDTSVTVGTVAVFPVNAVAANNVTSAASTTALSGIATATGSTGAIVLVTTNGTVTVSNAVSAGGSGNVLLEAQGASSDVLASAPIGSGSGSITISAARNATFTGTANVIVSGAGGTIDVTAKAGAISQLSTLEVQTDGSNILFTAATNIVLGIMDARVTSDQGGTPTSQSSWGNVALTAAGGTITNAELRVASVTNVYANGLRLESSAGIGVLGSGANNPIVTEVATVAAETDNSGGIDLLEQTAVAVDTVAAIPVNLVAVDGTTSTASSTAATLSDLTTAGNGSVVLVTNSGGITLDDGVNADGYAVTASGAGNVLIDAQGTGSNLVLNASINTGTGDVTLAAGGNVQLASGLGVVAAGNLNVDATGSLQMSANNQLDSTSGVWIDVGGDAVVGGVFSSNVWIEAGGSIANAGNQDFTNVTAANAVLNAGNGVGSSATPLQTGVTTFTSGSGSGGVNITQTGATTIGPVSFSILQVNPDSTTTANTVTQNGVSAGSGGAVSLITLSGGLTVDGNITSAAATTINAAGPISMAATVALTASAATLTATGDINVSQIDTGTGAISITGGGALINVLGSSGGENLIGGQTTIQTVGNQGTTANTLNTELSWLDATVTGPGTIVVAQTGALDLFATTSNGLIQVNASGSLTASSISGGGSAGAAITTGGDLLVGFVTVAGSVTATAAGQIENAAAKIPESSTPLVNFTTPQLTLSAGMGIGIDNFSPLVVAVPLLSASTTTGGIDIRNVLTTTVTVSNLSTGSGPVTYSQAGGTSDVTNASSGSGNVNLSMDNGNLVVQNVSAGGTGNVNLNVTGTGQIQYTTATAGGGDVNISTSLNTTITQDIVTNGENVTLDGAITLSRDTSITTNGGAVTFSNTIAGPYALTINSGAGAVDFEEPVGAGTGNALTALTVNTSSSITVGGTLTVAGNISFTSSGIGLAGGPGSVSTTNGGSFTVQASGATSTIGIGTVPNMVIGSNPAATFGYTTYFSGADIAALAPGFSQILIGSQANTTDVDIGSGTFTSPTLIESAGIVQVVSLGTLSISGSNPLTLTGGAGDNGQIVMQQGSKIAAGSGTVTLTADEINLASSAGNTTTEISARITGTGTLVLQPLTLSRPIFVGQSQASGQLDLSVAALTVPAATLNLVIGSAQGTGPITVDAVSFDNPVTFQAGGTGASLAFDGNVATTQAGDGISANVAGTITVAGNLVVSVSGSIDLAATGSNGAVVVAPSADEFLHAVSGDITLTGQSLTLGSASDWSKMLASGAVNLTVGATGGTLQMNNDYSEIKAGTNITISAGSTTASATGQLGLSGQIQAVGTITVTSNSSINLGSANLVALGSISLQSTGSVNLSAGIVNSQQGTITVTADSAQKGSGILALGGTAPILLSSTGSITLNGESIAIGSTSAFARVLSGGDLDIQADFHSAGMGTISFDNSSTQVEADGNLQIGASAFGAGTPYGVTISGATLSATGTFSLYSLASITTASTNIVSTGAFTIFADDNLTINSGTVLTAGAALSLLADASTGLQGALSLSSNVTINDPGYTVTLSGFTVSNNASITDAKLVSTSGQ